MPIEPFGNLMWAAELISFLSIFLVITLTRFALKNEKLDVAATWLQTWAEFLQQPINFTYVFNRIIFNF